MCMPHFEISFDQNSKSPKIYLFIFFQKVSLVLFCQINHLYFLFRETQNTLLICSNASFVFCHNRTTLFFVCFFLYFCNCNSGGGQDCDHWHAGTGFVTSHIAVTLMYEQALQAINPSIAVPYWDVTIEGTLYDWSNFRTSSVFADDWFGDAAPDNVSCAREEREEQGPQQKCRTGGWSRVGLGWVRRRPPQISRRNSCSSCCSGVQNSCSTAVSQSVIDDEDFTNVRADIFTPVSFVCVGPRPPISRVPSEVEAAKRIGAEHARTLPHRYEHVTAFLRICMISNRSVFTSTVRTMFDVFDDHVFSQLTWQPPLPSTPWCSKYVEFLRWKIV